MIYTEKTRQAMNIAFIAHLGQLDKSNVPYIFHPIHLAEQMDTEEECIVALLHDTVEDTDVSLIALSKFFSEPIIKALELLTHDDSVPYMDYISKIKDNPIARKVKLADLRHNSDTTRLENLSDEDIKRNEKYQKALAYLEN